MTAGASLGVGIGWRQEIDLTVPRLAAATGPGVDFVEVVAENVPPAAVPASLAQLHASGMPVVPHGVSLSLGGTDPLDPGRVARLAELGGRDRGGPPAAGPPHPGGARGADREHPGRAGRTPGAARGGEHRRPGQLAGG
jgi:hypothetical protein